MKRQNAQTNPALQGRRRCLPLAAALLLLTPFSGESKTIIPSVTGWLQTDYLIVVGSSDLNVPSGIAVLDQNFSFKGFLDGDFRSDYTHDGSSLGLTSDGRAVGITTDPCSYGYVGGEARIYSSNGSQTGGFLNPDLGCPWIMTLGPNNFLYVNSWLYGPTGIREFTFGGALQRTIGTASYGAMTVLSGGILWADQASFDKPPKVDVFDLSTGGKINTLTFREGQEYVCGMTYSPSRGTVLIGDDHYVYERSATGAFIRTFYYPNNPNWFDLIWGPTRGPGGGIVAVELRNHRVVRWAADGTFQGEVDLSGSIAGTFAQILWAGELVPPHLPPAISGSDRVDCVLPGSPISFQETASDPEGTIVTLSASPLPASSSFPAVSGTATVTGTFDWTPGGADIGNHTIVFSASDSGSPILTTTKNVTISVVSSSPITSHPQPQSICAGQTATFSTTATATAYQWQFSTDGINWVNISGATSSTYTTPPHYIDAYYRCIVIASCGAITTNVARLTITPLPGSPGNSLRANKNSPTSVHLNWASCTAASSYRVLRCGASPSPCIPALLGTTGAISTDDTAASGAVLWYAIESTNACGVTP